MGASRCMARRDALIRWLPDARIEALFGRLPPLHTMAAERLPRGHNPRLVGPAFIFSCSLRLALAQAGDLGNRAGFSNNHRRTAPAPNPRPSTPFKQNRSDRHAADDR